MIIKGKKVKSLYRKSSIKPPGGLYFFKHFLGRGGPKRENGNNSPQITRA